MTTYHLKMTIDETEPPVWRKIAVPDHITFHQLHLVIQECFQWQDYHLYKFELPDVESPITRLFGDPFIDEGNDADAREMLIDPYIAKGGRFRYIYDFGDWWEHIIDVIDVDPLDDARAPRVTAFQGDSMIEDAGGVGGYYRIMDILHDARNSRHGEIEKWVEWQAPRPFSADTANAHMDELLYFPKAAYSSSAAPDAGICPARRVKLQDVVDALEYQSDTLAAYIDLDAAEVRTLFLEDFVGQEEYERSLREFESCNSLMLPRSEELDDYGVMRSFAFMQEGAAGDRLKRAVEGRGAFKRFKGEVAKLGIGEDWLAFRDESRAETARDFLEANGVRWA